MLSDIEAELEREVRDLRAVLTRERRARELRTEVGELAAATSGRISRTGVARVLARGIADVFGTGFVMVAFVADESMVHIEHGLDVPAGIVEDWKNIPLDTDVPICEVLRGDQNRLELSDVAAMSRWPLLAAELDRSGIASLATGAIGHHGAPQAALLVGWPEEHLMDTTESELFTLVSGLAAPAFERARRTESDDELSRAVQRWLREGAIADVAGFDVATLYEPGRDLMRVGGDWFDVVELGDGSAAVVIGDVVGHDVRAAIEMSQVRHVLASQLISSGDPVLALTATDGYLRARAPHIMATALVATFDRHGHVSLASAGHPPPVIVGVDGAARVGVCGLGPPLGAGLGGYTSRSGPASIGETFVVYTDGLVEHRDESIDAGIERLRIESEDVAGSSGWSVGDMVDRFALMVDSPWRLDDAAAVVVRIAG